MITIPAAVDSSYSTLPTPRRDFLSTNPLSALLKLVRLKGPSSKASPARSHVQISMSNLPPGRGDTHDIRPGDNLGSSVDKLPAQRVRIGGTPATAIGDGWTRYIHISGSVYYYHARYNLVTPDNIIDDAHLRAVLEFRTDLYDSIQEDGLCIPQNSQLLIRDAYENPQAVFLIHARRLHITFLDPDLADYDVVEEFSTISYWNIVEEHPMHLEQLPMHTVSTFLAATTFGASEMILGGKDSRFPYTDEQLEEILRIFWHLYESHKTHTGVIPALILHTASTIGRIESARCLSSKNHTQDMMMGFSMRRPPLEIRSTWQLEAAEVFLTMVLFGTHRLYLSRLRNVRQRGSVRLLDFRALLQKFLAEWSDSNLLATVFVGANIGFQSLSNLPDIPRTASLASALLATLSVACGVHHVWRHRAKANADINDAVKYVNYSRDYARVVERRGADTIDDLAVLSAFLALPVAALMWSVLCFALALGVYSFGNAGPAARVLLGMVLGALALVSMATVLFFQCVWRAPRPATVRTKVKNNAGRRGWKLPMLRAGKEVVKKLQGKARLVIKYLRGYQR